MMEVLVFFFDNVWHFLGLVIVVTLFVTAPAIFIAAMFLPESFWRD